MKLQSLLNPDFISKSLISIQISKSSPQNHNSSSSNLMSKLKIHLFFCSCLVLKKSKKKQKEKKKKRETKEKRVEKKEKNQKIKKKFSFFRSLPFFIMFKSGSVHQLTRILIEAWSFCYLQTTPAATPLSPSQAPPDLPQSYWHRPSNYDSIIGFTTISGPL